MHPLEERTIALPRPYARPESAVVYRASPVPWLVAAIIFFATVCTFAGGTSYINRTRAELAKQQQQLQAWQTDLQRREAALRR